MHTYIYIYKYMHTYIHVDSETDTDVHAAFGFEACLSCRLAACLSTQSKSGLAAASGKEIVTRMPQQPAKMVLASREDYP